MLLFCVVDARPSLPLYPPLQVLGQSSLFMYVFHYAIIAYVVVLVLGENLLTFPGFVALYGSLLLLLFLVAYGLKNLKARWRNCPYLLKFLLGA
ncbi:MAG: hypothetical protein HC890_13120 [Chloroflexaceae bacterium]|nr:hypothetical protein [Chloroflexaceae bacterium]